MVLNTQHTPLVCRKFLSPGCASRKKIIFSCLGQRADSFSQLLLVRSDKCIKIPLKISIYKTLQQPGDLGTRKRPGTSCKLEIHFLFKITQYLINGIRFLFQICPRHSFPCARHRHKVSNSFTKESGRDK